MSGDPLFVTTDGDLSAEQRPGGTVLTDDRRQPKRTFRITGGTNPYSAQEVVVDDETGVVSTYTEGYTLDATSPAGLLWEISGDATVPTDGTVVVPAWPNPVGPGFLFDAGRSIPCPPPPPPPPVGTWYCIAGNPVFVTTGGTAPPRFDCGPFDQKPDCTACTPIGASGGIGISDTAYAGPYTTGDTLALSLAKTGAFTGTPTWRVYPLDPLEATNSGTDAGTGNTFAPSVQFLAQVASTVGFVVLLTDSGDPTKAAFTTAAASLQVDPPAIAVRSAAGDLTDADALQLTQANTPGGGFTLTLQVSALGRGKSWWRVQNTGTGTLTVNQTGGETINGAASITVAAGANVTLYPDNKSTWKAL